MELRQQIEQFITAYKGEMVEQLCRLVQIPSIRCADHSGYPYGAACAKALDFCTNLAQQKGLWVKNHEYRCAEAGIGCSGGKRLVFAAHTDVVDVDHDDIYPPFGGQIVGNYVVGRGAVDDKGPLVAVLYALAFLKEQNIPLQSDIRLVFGANEEQGMDDLEYYLQKVGQPHWGLAVDDDFPTTNGEKGLLRFILRAKAASGVSVSSCGKNQRLVHDCCTIIRSGIESRFCRPEAQNPPAQMVLQQHQQGLPLFQDSAQNETAFLLTQDKDGHTLGIYSQDEHSGESTLRLFACQSEEDVLALHFDVRLPVSASLCHAKAAIAAFAAANGFGVEFTKESPGYFVPADHPIVDMLTQLYNREYNDNRQPYVMGACTYARLFTNGCGFGAGNPYEVKPFPPGHGAAHGPDEAHNIDVLCDAVKMYILGILAVENLWYGN